MFGCMEGTTNNGSPRPTCATGTIYLYSSQELEKWRDRTLEIAATTDTTYVVANNHNLGKAAVNALELISLLERRPVPVPAPLLESYPELKQIVLL